MGLPDTNGQNGNGQSTGDYDNWKAVQDNLCVQCDHPKWRKPQEKETWEIEEIPSISGRTRKSLAAEGSYFIRTLKPVSPRL